MGGAAAVGRWREMKTLVPRCDAVNESRVSRTGDAPVWSELSRSWRTLYADATCSVQSDSLVSKRTSRASEPQRTGYFARY